MIRALAALALIGGAPMAAADGEAAEIRGCIEVADRPADCIGRTVSACVERPGGDTTVGMSDCIAAEGAGWDEILNEEFGATVAALREEDATGDLAAPELTRVDTLRAAQRAWMAFRDAECRAQYALWGGGSLRQLAGANCVMTETAERALELRAMRQP